MPAGIEIPAARFAGLQGQALEQAWFQAGLVPGALGAALDTVVDRPRDPDDPLFWQYPCRTEGAAWERHAQLVEPRRIGDELHLYLGLPWATWIDKARKDAWGATGLARADAQWQRTRVRLSGLRGALREAGLGLRVHTVCQHIYWADLLTRWQDLGVTDLWLSHCPTEQESAGRLRLHPWRLYAVNVEDPQRRDGLDIGRDAAQRPLLASFVGAHAGHYLSDVRLRMRALAEAPDVVIDVTDQWHFEQVVYREQVRGRAVDGAPASDVSVRRYNRLLSDSVFSLCPAGAGANTLRLWESLGSGAIPVMLGPWPRLPEGGSLAHIDWDRALLRIADGDLSTLLQRLRAIPITRRRDYQRCGREAFEAVLDQRCF